MPKRKVGGEERKVRLSLQLFVPQSFIERLDSLREKQLIVPSRAKLVIHLLEQGLEKEVKRGA